MEKSGRNASLLELPGIADKLWDRFGWLQHFEVAYNQWIITLKMFLDNKLEHGYLDCWYRCVESKDNPENLIPDQNFGLLAYENT